MNNNIEYRSAVKKNLIDMLMFSLYDDPRTIYREYVQNALDSINAAVRSHVLEQLKDGVVNIGISTRENTIFIRDNGTGIKANVAIPRLLDISASPKNGITAAGQFGIGRLVGGGYCHKLEFKTSAKGESIATIVSFDIDAIWKMVKEDEEDYLASYFIDKCTRKEQVEEIATEHYFEVTLYDVRGDIAPTLLKEQEVVSYLNTVAPVAYTSEFTNVLIYRSTQDMPEFKELHEGLEKVQVFVGQRRIEKQYGLTIKGTKDEIDRLEYFKIETPTLELLAWGWFALTKFSIQIPKDDELACIRLRKHNIQIGNFNLLSVKPLWKEERGNSYFYGELFIAHKNIVPNAARDGLAPTPEKEALYFELEKFFKELQGVYTKANTAKKSIEKIREGAKKIIDTNNGNDRVALDFIDNKGKGVYKKLVKSASFAPLKHMLSLYEDDYNVACTEVEEAKNSIKKPNPQTDAQGEISSNSTIKKESPNLIKSEGSEEGKELPAQQIPSGNDPAKINPTIAPGPQEGQAKKQPTLPDDDPTPATSLPKNILRYDMLASLNNIMSEDEIWILRRVFRVLNSYCPQNEDDQHLIEILEKEIVREFEHE